MRFLGLRDEVAVLRAEVQELRKELEKLKAVGDTVNIKGDSHVVWEFGRICEVDWHQVPIRKVVKAIVEHLGLKWQDRTITGFYKPEVEKDAK